MYVITHLLTYPREQEAQDVITDLLLYVHTEIRNTLNALEAFLQSTPCFAPSCGKGSLHTIGGLGRPPKRKQVSQNLLARVPGEGNHEKRPSMPAFSKPLYPRTEKTDGAKEFETSYPKYLIFLFVSISWEPCICLIY